MKYFARFTMINTWDVRIKYKKEWLLILGLDCRRQTNNQSSFFVKTAVDVMKWLDVALKPFIFVFTIDIFSVEKVTSPPDRDANGNFDCHRFSDLQACKQVVESRHPEVFLVSQSAVVNTTRLWNNARIWHSKGPFKMNFFLSLDSNTWTTNVTFNCDWFSFWILHSHLPLMILSSGQWTMKYFIKTYQSKTAHNVSERKSKTPSWTVSSLIRFRWG